MQITIVQSEIEKAIIDYIKSQVSVHDSMEIDIDLRATRGAEGFQAIIDIHPKRSGGGSSKPSGPKGSGSSSSKPLKIEETVAGAKSSRRGRPKSTPKAETETPAPAAANEAEDQQEDVQATANEPQPDTQPEAQPEAQPETPAEAQADAKTEAPKVSSIFAQKKDEAKAEGGSDQPTAKPKSLFGDLKRPVNA